MEREVGAGIVLPNVLPMPAIQRGVETHHVLFLTEQLLRGLAVPGKKSGGVSKLKDWRRGDEFHLQGP